MKMSNENSLSIIIVVYNSSKLIEGTIKSLIRHIRDLEYEIIVVDNKSYDDTVAIVKNIRGNIRVKLNDRNYGFAKANNIGFKESRGEYILILNPDIEFTDQTDIHLLIRKLNEQEDNGIIAPKLLYGDGTIQESARSFPGPLVLLIRGMKIERFFIRTKFYRKFLMLDKPADTDVHPDWVIGAFMFMKRKIFEALGGFDEKYFMYYEDVDLCNRARQLGYKIVYTSKTSAIHQYQRQSAKKMFSVLKYHHLKSIFRFLSKRYLKNSLKQNARLKF